VCRRVGWPPLVSQIIRGELLISGRVTWSHISNASSDEKLYITDETALTTFAQPDVWWYFSELNSPYHLFADSAASEPIGLCSFDHTLSRPHDSILCLEISFSSNFRDSSLGTSKSATSFHEVLLLEALPDKRFHRGIGAAVIYADSCAFEGRESQQFRVL
jgi:hypothetical protein